MNEMYEQFNQALSSGLVGQTRNSTPSNNNTTSRLMDGKSFTNLGELTGKGSLVVQVTLARGAIPVEGAKVTISSAEEEPVVISEMYTDKSGRTTQLSLPAPQSGLSQAPGGVIRPYSIYNIKIEFPGYYTEKAINVPIFDKINSIQPVALEPLPEDSKPQSQPEIIVDESTQGPNLL